MPTWIICESIVASCLLGIINRLTTLHTAKKDDPTVVYLRQTYNKLNPSLHCLFQCRSGHVGWTVFHHLLKWVGSQQFLDMPCLSRTVGLCHGLCLRKCIAMLSCDLLSWCFLSSCALVKLRFVASLHSMIWWFDRCGRIGWRMGRYRVGNQEVTRTN